jgi:transcriptional regulator with XRE-family HTH domain
VHLVVSLVDCEEAARRVRAAMAYAGLDQQQAVKASGIPISTLRRIVATKSPRGASMEELWAIADACRVPRWFMEEGFSRTANASDELEARVERIEVVLSTGLKAIGVDIDQIPALQFKVPHHGNPDAVPSASAAHPTAHRTPGPDDAVQHVRDAAAASGPRRDSGESS